MEPIAANRRPIGQTCLFSFTSGAACFECSVAFDIVVFFIGRRSESRFITQIDGWFESTINLHVTPRENSGFVKRCRSAVDDGIYADRYVRWGSVTRWPEKTRQPAQRLLPWQRSREPMRPNPQHESVMRRSGLPTASRNRRVVGANDNAGSMRTAAPSAADASTLFPEPKSAIKNDAQRNWQGRPNKCLLGGGAC